MGIGIEAVRIYTDHIGLEFGSGKCAMLMMKSGKLQTIEGIELPNEKIRTLKEKETYKYLGILEADTIKQVEIKGKKFKQVYLWRTRKLL